MPTKSPRSTRAEMKDINLLYLSFLLIIFFLPPQGGEKVSFCLSSGKTAQSRIRARFLLYCLYTEPSLNTGLIIANYATNVNTFAEYSVNAPKNGCCPRLYYVIKTKGGYFAPPQSRSFQHCGKICGQICLCITRHRREPTVRAHFPYPF